MPTPTIADYLKYAELQTAAEAFIRDEQTGELKNTGTEYLGALTTGNGHTLKFTSTQAAERFATRWEVLDQKANTSTGFSGTLFKAKKDDPASHIKAGDLVLAFRSTEFIDDEVRDSQATNDLEIKQTGFAWGQIADMKAWYEQLNAAGGQLAGKSFAVTGYSLGGHLATAFNLLRHGDGSAGRIKEVVTFNGAGVGKMREGYGGLADGGLAAAVAYFQQLRAEPVFIKHELALTYSGLEGFYDTLRGNVNSGAWTAARAAQEFDQWLRAQVVSQSQDLVRGQFQPVLDALGKISIVTGEIARLLDLRSGDTQNSAPKFVGPGAMEADNLDYRLAVELAARRSQSNGTPANTLQSVAGKLYGTPLLGNQYDVVGDTLPSGVAHSERHHGQDVRVFIEDQPLFRGTVVSGVLEASEQLSAPKLLVNGYAKNDFGDTHSLALLVDSLSVQHALLQLLPEAQREAGAATLQAVFKRASYLRASPTLTQVAGLTTQGQAEGDVLEDMVNALAAVFLGPVNPSERLQGSPEGNTWHETEDKDGYSGRASLQARLERITQSPAYQGAAGKLGLAASDVNWLAVKASTDFGAYIALSTLSPFVLTGESRAVEEAVKGVWDGQYQRWLADIDTRAHGRPDSQLNISREWYQDRLELMRLQLAFNQVNAEPFAPAADTPQVLTQLGSVYHEDAASGYRIQQGALADTAPRYYFGDAGQAPGQAGGSFTGGAGNDRLYGGAGDDTLTGGAGDDYLEGGLGSDSLQGGAGKDTYLLLGAAPGGGDSDTASDSGTEADNYTVRGPGTVSLTDAGGGDSYSLNLSGGTLTLNDQGTGSDTYRISGSGSLTLIDAGGADRYYFDNFTGSLHIIDLGRGDGTDRLYQDGTLLSDAYVPVAGQTKTWTAARGGSITLTQNSPLSVHGGNGGSVVLENYEDGDYGIHLVRAGVDPGALQLLGDQKPVDQNADEPGIQPGYDALGNVIVEPGVVFPMDDHLQGGDGSDRLEGLLGVDGLYGGAGDDVMVGGGDADVLDGGAGDDLLYVGFELEVAEYLALQGNIQLFDALQLAQGGTGNDLILGGNSHHNLSGGAGDDSLITNLGQDTLSGGAGNDVLLGNAGDDQLWGDVGSRPMEASTIWVVETMGSGRIVASLDEEQASGDDALIGGEGNDFLSGDGGHDLLDGGNGVDEIIGGAGHDVLIGAGGNDLLAGDAPPLGHDSIFDISYDSNVHTPAEAVAQQALWEQWLRQRLMDGGNDYLNGGQGHDELYGGGGADTLYGGSGNDHLEGDFTDSAVQGNDLLDGGDGDDQLLGGGGSDTIVGGADDDKLVGDGSDTPGSQHGNDHLDGGDGNDELLGGGGNDVLLGGSGFDWLEGDDAQGTVTPGDDRLEGGSENDYLMGHGGSDTLLGGDGDDGLFGGANTFDSDLPDGNDLLQGGEGNDQLTGGAGDDTLDGGAGLDVYVFRPGWGHDSVMGVSDIQISNLEDSVLFTVAGDQANLESTASDSVAYARQGSDLLLTAGADSVLFQGWFLDGANVQSLAFSDGVVQADAITRMLLPPQYGGASSDTLNGNEETSDELHGEDGGDTLSGLGGNDQLHGGGGNDVLLGGTGRDKLSGGEGNDSLQDGAGQDLLEGGEGNDQYVFAADGEADTVTDSGGDDQYVLVAGQGSLLATDYSGGNVFELPGVSSGMLRGVPDQDVLTIAWGSGDELVLLSGPRPEDRLWLSDGDFSMQLAVDLYNMARGTSGDDYLAGYAGFTNSLEGGAGNDYLTGGVADDTLNGGTGDDTLLGGAGHDRYLFAADHGHDVVQDSGGASVYDFGGIESVRLVISNEQLSITHALNGTVLLQHGLNPLDQIITGQGQENLQALVDAANAERATASDDNLIGLSGFRNALAGGEGSDRLIGRELADLLDGGAGGNVLEGGAGDDVLIAGHEGDELQGGSGADEYRLSAGRHFLSDNGLLDDGSEGAVNRVILDLPAAATLSALRLGDDLHLIWDDGRALIAGYGLREQAWHIERDGQAVVPGAAVADVESYWAAFGELGQQWLRLGEPALPASYRQSGYFDVSSEQFPLYDAHAGVPVNVWLERTPGIGWVEAAGAGQINIDYHPATRALPPQAQQRLGQMRRDGFQAWAAAELTAGLGALTPGQWSALTQNNHVGVTLDIVVPLGHVGPALGAAAPEPETALVAHLEQPREYWLTLGNGPENRLVQRSFATPSLHHTTATGWWQEGWSLLGADPLAGPQVQPGQAYVVLSGGGHGMQVYSLAQLQAGGHEPGSIAEVLAGLPLPTAALWEQVNEYRPFDVVTVTGSEGDDTVEGEQALLLRADLGAGDDRAHGSPFADLLLGGAGADALTAAGGADVLAGGAGDDLLTGGRGADTYWFDAAEAGLDVLLDTGFFLPASELPKLDLADLGAWDGWYVRIPAHAGPAFRLMPVHCSGACRSSGGITPLRFALFIQRGAGRGPSEVIHAQDPRDFPAEVRGRPFRTPDCQGGPRRPVHCPGVPAPRPRGRSGLAATRCLGRGPAGADPLSSACAVHRRAATRPAAHRAGAAPQGRHPPVAVAGVQDGPPGRPAVQRLL
jgi:Ca2+-binding RTX toxin-like protein